MFSSNSFDVIYKEKCFYSDVFLTEKYYINIKCSEQLDLVEDFPGHCRWLG